MKKSAFTLVEIMIVVAIIGLLAAIAIPNLQRAQQDAKVTRFIAEMKTLENALHWYSADTGSYPPDTPALGVAAPELAPYLANFDWTVTPLGGQWDWDNHGTNYKITASISSADTLLVDQKIDDGNTSTGTVRYDTLFRYFIWEQ